MSAAAQLERARLAGRIGAVALLTGAPMRRWPDGGRRPFDAYLLQAEPILLGEIARALVALVPSTSRVDAFAGLELGGMALATMCSHVSQRPARFVRKVTAEHPSGWHVEGGPVEAMRLAVVDDVLGDGNATAQSCWALQQAGAHVARVLCVIDRQEGAAEQLARIGVEMKALFGAAELEGHGWRAMLDGRT